MGERRGEGEGAVVWRVPPVADWRGAGESRAGGAKGGLVG